MLTAWSSSPPWCCFVVSIHTISKLLAHLVNIFMAMYWWCILTKCTHHYIEHWGPTECGMEIHNPHENFYCERPFYRNNIVFHTKSSSTLSLVYFCFLLRVCACPQYYHINILMESVSTWILFLPNRVSRKYLIGVVWFYFLWNPRPHVYDIWICKFQHIYPVISMSLNGNSPPYWLSF